MTQYVICGLMTTILDAGCVASEASVLKMRESKLWRKLDS